MGKAVCSKHERAYEVGVGCPWCEPAEAKPAPAMNACFGIDWGHWEQAMYVVFNPDGTVRDRYTVKK